MPYLTIIRKDVKAEAPPARLPAGRPVTVGRSVTSSIQVRDLKMSRVHFELSVADGIAVITDLGSKNGTFVNGKRVASTALREGDIIQVGYSKFKYHEGEPGEPAGAAKELHPTRMVQPAAKSHPSARPATKTLSSAKPATMVQPPAGLEPKTQQPAKPAVMASTTTHRTTIPPVLKPPSPPQPPPVGVSSRPQVPQSESTPEQTIADSIGIVLDVSVRPLADGEAACCSCRQPVTARELKTAVATSVCGQVCCAKCIVSDPLLGRTVAGYRIDVRLGRGTWATTYKAEQLSMARPVVLRVIGSEVAANHDTIERFLVAVKLGGQISHPNLARIYDIGHTNDVCYVSVEYVDGETVRQRLNAKTTFPIEKAVHIIAEVSGALEIAHQRNMFHRDIRPSNIVLNEDNVPKLIGLGFTKSMEDAAAAGSVRLKRAADAVLYWPPECIENPALANQQADVYSLGAVCYAMIAGTAPFEPASPADLVSAIRSAKPKPLSALRDGVPRRLSTAIAKAMAKDPADRQRDCREFSEDIRTAID